MLLTVATFVLPLVQTPPVVVVEAPKDRDGDGIIDAEDKCPDVKGLASLQGCPDRDGDGITDAEDKCPDVKGLAKYNGCPIPDTDKDGINDEQDKCPTVPGVAKYQGCPIPDTDGDGINDEEDKCPTVPGVAKYQGCPIPDTDKDGINDENDKCPDVPGVARYQGCTVPDTDGDGIADKDDKCPYTAGVSSNNGCPAVVSSIEAVVPDTTNYIVYFEPGKSVLRSDAYNTLTAIVGLLKTDSKMRVVFKGHTDNAGSMDANHKISLERADVCAAYVQSFFIDKNRIALEAYGKDKPAADLNDPLLQWKNRRVEVIVYRGKE